MSFSKEQNDLIWRKFHSRLYEEETHTIKRTLLIQYIQESYVEWLKCRKVCLPFSSTPLICTGSVSLNTSHNYSDTDIVFFAPNSIDRSFFFHHFARFLQHAGKKRGIFSRSLSRSWIPVTVDQIEVRHHAFVPLVRMRINFILFDCLLVTLPQEMFVSLSSNPEMKLQSVFQNAVERNSFLIQLDEKSRLTMNSVFTSFSLLQHVPQEKRFLWSQYIRLVNLWSGRRNLCSNITAFPSRIAYVIMATKVFLLYPNDAHSLNLLWHFFETYSDWDWNQNEVQLISSEAKTHKDAQDSMVVWLPDFQLGGGDAVRVNTCKNVNPCTLRILQKEFEIARFKFQPNDNAVDLYKMFSSLMERRTFFHRYQNFIKIGFLSNGHQKNEVSVDFLKWQLKYLLSEMCPYLLCGEVYEHYFQKSSTPTKYLYIGFELKDSMELRQIYRLLYSFEHALRNKACKTDTEFHLTVLEPTDSIIVYQKACESSRIKLKTLI